MMLHLPIVQDLTQSSYEMFPLGLLTATQPFLSLFVRWPDELGAKLSSCVVYFCSYCEINGYFSTYLIGICHHRIF